MVVWCLIRREESRRLVCSVVLQHFTNDFSAVPPVLHSQAFVTFIHPHLNQTITSVVPYHNLITAYSSIGYGMREVVAQRPLSVFKLNQLDYLVASGVGVSVLRLQ